MGTTTIPAVAAVDVPAPLTAAGLRAWLRRAWGGFQVIARVAGREGRLA